MSKEQWPDIWAWLHGDAATALVAGLAGGLVRWVTLRESLRDGLASLVVGCACALYLGPLVEPNLEKFVGLVAPAADTSGFSGFVMGLAGISIAGFIIDLINRGARSKALGGAADAENANAKIDG